MYSGRWQVLVNHGCLIPTWEIWTEFLAPGFCLSYLWLLWPFEKWTSRQKNLFLCQVNKKKWILFKRKSGKDMTPVCTSVCLRFSWKDKSYTVNIGWVKSSLENNSNTCPYLPLCWNILKINIMGTSAVVQWMSCHLQDRCPKRETNCSHLHSEPADGRTVIVSPLQLRLSNNSIF